MNLLLLFLLLIGLGFSKESIIATTYPIYHPLAYLAGDIHSVSVLIPTKADVHHYEPTPRDVASLKKAKAVFAMGLEGWERRLPVKREKLHLLHDGIDLITLGGHKDPHVWMSPRSYQKLVDNIFKALVKMDPKNKELYQRRHDEYSKKLAELDRKFERVLSTCENRWLISTHLSLNYLARDYGLKAGGLRGVHAEEEPRPSEVLRLIGLMKKESIKAIFVEEGYKEGVVKKLSQETGAKTYRINTSLHPTSTNYDYFSIMEMNLNSFAEGLSCKR